jgi:post-segregation antitoxin (ccd killing protein)
MARVNVYLPDELAEAAREAGVNVSGITQAALRAELDAMRSSAWLVQVRDRRGPSVARSRIVEALDEVRRDAGDGWPEARS